MTPLEIWGVLKDVDHQHERANNKYLDQAKALGNVSGFIESCVPATYQYLIMNISAREMLQKLQARFSPKGDPIYAGELRDKWVTQYRVLQSGVNIDKWATKTESLYMSLERAGRSSLIQSATWDLLDAIRIVPEMHIFYAMMYNELLVEGKKMEFFDFLTRTKLHLQFTINPQKR